MIVAWVRRRLSTNGRPGGSARKQASPPPPTAGLPTARSRVGCTAAARSWGGASTVPRVQGSTSARLAGRTRPAAPPPAERKASPLSGCSRAPGMHGHSCRRGGKRKTGGWPPASLPSLCVAANPETPPPLRRPAPACLAAVLGVGQRGGQVGRLVPVACCSRGGGGVEGLG